MNRIAVVTGANRGIGREVARQLADQGDVVYLTARQAADAAAAVIQLGSAANLRSHQLDVTDSASVDRLVRLKRRLLDVGPAEHFVQAALQESAFAGGFYQRQRMSVRGSCFLGTASAAEQIGLRRR